MSEIKISRRVLIGSMAYLVTACALPTSEIKSIQLQKVKLDGQYFNAQQLTLLTDVAEIMIPKTNTPGATDANVIAVLDAMMLTWAGKKTKQQFNFCINQISQIAKNTFSAYYTEITLSDRRALIEQLDANSFAQTDTELSASYRKLKKIIFHIFYTSEEANPDFILVPGGYKGSLTKTELDEINKRGYLG
ncbi:gluconate 2-dehydrogenase subunit 3 family protein [Catenovulum maritimum]|uniref:Twin-arginine translocation pathway signal n=1 Tax=Catenovulum maritimum TaxID=1513271 RepID=A0A0J8GU61_9ALTE|nr:gluconate 2-dehydrogenase subunit 3 family protein [Catenovulum maritimum]KMT64849.1 hypothetical protein XM47_12480 [Catenovulum maritimum]